MDFKNYQKGRMDDPTKYDIAIEKLKLRGVTIEDIALITYDLQIKYVKDLTLDICIDHVNKVILKREVQHAIFVAIDLDMLAEKKMLSEPLQSIVEADLGLFGVDEILALSVVNVYGSIGMTNFGYVDKLKPGIIGHLDNEGKKGGRVNTFLDDIVGAIAASAASSVAHNYLG
ncbi:MAG: phosphatidylglycerophosphatase A [Acholeplasmataceae bacterium]|jgi:phosphatidylglycerophosphatase A